MISTPFVPDPNSPERIQQRAAANKLSWVAPFLFLPARSILLILGQALFALLYRRRGDPSPWSTAGAWWTVWGTLADAGCLAILFVLTRREHLRIRDLLGTFPPRFFLRGFGYFFVIAPFSAAGSVLASWIVYGSWMAPLPAGILVARHLPLWGMLYSLVVWPPIWAATEELTYNGYLAPRIAALSRRVWVSLALVAFWWAAQHCFLPFVADGRFIFCRFLSFVPGVLALLVLYWRTQKLPSVIVALWVMDVIAAATTLSFR